MAPLIVEQMASAILTMKHEGIAILLSEQNLDFASMIAARALLLEAGNVTFDGPITDLDARHTTA